jgi:hypothetical protein
LCAEFVNEKGLWEVIGSRPNHGLDCSVLNILAAEILGVKYLRRHDKKIIDVEAPKEIVVAKSKFMS